jgi:3-phosphoshikimate 1-carboxyvinyltransferase
MKLKISKTQTLLGHVVPPGSKSQTVRGLLLALLSQGESHLLNSLDSDDAQAAISVCKNLGVEINTIGNQLTITSQGLPLKTKSDLIHTDNSGITTRFIMPILGLRKNTEKPIVLTCGEQMRARPISSLVNALIKLGLNINYLEKNGVLPISISGNLLGGVAEVDGITSQYVSALLLSLPCAPNDSEITVRNLHERPYVDMTLSCLNKQNIQYVHERSGELDIFKIKGKQSYKKFQIQIPGDFSSASYFIAAAVLSEGCVELTGLDFHDPQGDKRLVTILQEMGADITVETSRLIIRGGRVLRGIKIDANDIPDLLPTLAVIGTQATGKTEIINVKQARIKETDRIHSMTEGLRLLGARVDEHEDGLCIYKSTLKGAEIRGFGDHRTVMALSIAGLLAEGSTIIDDAESINKTYPNYIRDMKSIGAKMELQKHIVLIGFKSVGKSAVGRQLALQLGKAFIDLDKQIENVYENENNSTLSCRQIMQKHGEAYFRELEHKTLLSTVDLNPSVISVGGGTPLYEKNHLLLNDHCLVHITAPKAVIYERIMMNGRPAFFDINEDLCETFNRLYEERSKVYEKLTNTVFHNNTTLEKIVSEIILSLGEGS